MFGYITLEKMFGYITWMDTQEEALFRLDWPTLKPKRALWSKRSISPGNGSYYKTVIKLQCLGHSLPTNRVWSHSGLYKNDLGFPGDPTSRFIQFEHLFWTRQKCLQKYRTNKNLYKRRPYRTLCRGPRTRAFVEEMVSPIYIYISVINLVAGCNQIALRSICSIMIVPKTRPKSTDTGQNAISTIIFSWIKVSKFGKNE